MIKKWIALNLLLLAIAALIGWQLRESIFRFNAQNDVGKIVPLRGMQKKGGREAASSAAAAAQYNPDDFAVISEKNLFVETRRKEAPAAEPTAPPEPPPLAQKPVLVGIAIVENQRTASIIDPTAAAGRGATPNRAQVRRIGDVYQGYTITEILKDRIVLQSGNRKEVIPLHEGTKRAAPGKTAIVATRVVPIGASSGSSGVTVARGSAPPPARTVVSSTTTVTGQPQPAGVQPAAAPARTGQQTPAGRGTTAGRSTSTAPSAQPSPSPSGSEGGTRTIRTPFGTFVRPER